MTFFNLLLDISIPKSTLVDRSSGEEINCKFQSFESSILQNCFHEKGKGKDEIDIVGGRAENLGSLLIVNGFVNTWSKSNILESLNIN